MAGSSKKGPKPRWGEDVGPCVRKNISMPQSLWDWCEQEALFSPEQKTASASDFITRILMAKKSEVESQVTDEN